MNLSRLRCGGEIQLCWDIDNREWSFHIPYVTIREECSGDAVTGVDEGIINSMALATWTDEHTIDVTIINGREGRAIKRLRNKSVGLLQHKLSKAKNGSKHQRRLMAAKKKVNAKARHRLRDFDHQVARKSADHVIQKALHGTYVPIGPNVTIRVTYHRAIERWSKDQRDAHRKVERRKVGALSSAQNRASSREVSASKQTQAQSLTSPLGPDSLVAVA